MIPKSIKLRDCIVQLNTGLNPRDNFSLGEGSIKYITAKNLNKAGYIDFSSCDYIDEQAKEIIHRRSDIQLGDILFASRAPIGHCHLITEDPSFYDVGESIFCIRVNKEIIVPEYLCLYLSSDLFIKMASKRVTGSVIQEIRISDLLDTDVVLPDKHVQTKIAKCIGYIDKKIELNKTICFNLESMAKLLYDYWFVQFDFPNENGKPYKSSGGKMVWNEELKREIPDGWSAKKLSKIADIVTTSITTENSSYYLHYSIPAFDENKMPSNDKGDAIDSNKYLVPDNAVLVSKLNPHFQRVWWVGKHRKNSICSTEFMPFVAQTNIYEYLYSLLKSVQFYTFMVNSSSSSTGSRKRMQPDLCLDFMIPYPDDDRIIHSYCSITNPVLQKVSESLKENQQLASLRDFLLPMLMNGQVKVKEGETQ